MQQLLFNVDLTGTGNEPHPVLVNGQAGDNASYRSSSPGLPCCGSLSSLAVRRCFRVQMVIMQGTIQVLIRLVESREMLRKHISKPLNICASKPSFHISIDAFNPQH